MCVFSFREGAAACACVSELNMNQHMQEQDTPHAVFDFLGAPQGAD
jgi:hypothetical protein